MIISRKQYYGRITLEQYPAFKMNTWCMELQVNTLYNKSIFLFFFQVKIWFQNHRYKYKRQAKEKSMTEHSPSSQVWKIKTRYYRCAMLFYQRIDPF